MRRPSATALPSRRWCAWRDTRRQGRLTACSRRPGVVAEAGQRQLTFACPGYASASSGGPFLTGISQRSGQGTIVGLIGGYQQGGASPSLSYSSPFGQIIHRLYRSVTGQPGDVVDRLHLALVAARPSGHNPTPHAAACRRIQEGGCPDSAAIARQVQPAARRRAR